SPAVAKRPPNPCGKRRHHRAASHAARGGKITTEDYAKPLLLPRRILWCRKGGEAERWLCHTRLPWWFFGSFINFCFGHRSGKSTLAQCLKGYPIDEQALIEEMEDYFDAWTEGEEHVRHTVLVDLYELEHHRHPATFLKEAQEELLWQIRQAPDVKRFYFHQRRRWCPGSLTEDEKESLRIVPEGYGYPTFSLPVRSGVSHPNTTSASNQHGPTIEPSKSRQDHKASNPDRVVVPASESVAKSSAPNSANPRTFTVPLRPGAGRPNGTAPKPINHYHDVLVLRSQTRIDRRKFIRGYNG
ncbi:unnamed protein product, partial [Aureobasidium mustum]